MVIIQVPDAVAERQRVTALGVRAVEQKDQAGYKYTHFHPSDTSGVLLSLDQTIAPAGTDPKLWWPKGRALRRLLQKKLGFRALFDVVPLDAGLVKGSHGLRVADPSDRPVLIGDGPAPAEAEVAQTAVRDLILRALDLE